jgi:hypothetical protein
MLSRWLEWKPTKIIETTAEHHPTEPTKPGFDGFVGSFSDDFAITGGCPTGGTIPVDSEPLAGRREP